MNSPLLSLAAASLAAKQAAVKEAAAKEAATREAAKEAAAKEAAARAAAAAAEAAALDAAAQVAMDAAARENNAKLVAAKDTAARASAKQAADAAVAAAKADALRHKLEGEVEAFRQEVQFMLMNKSFAKCVALCDAMLHRLQSLGESRRRWRLPLLVQRAHSHLRWADAAVGSSRGDADAADGTAAQAPAAAPAPLGERASRLKAAFVDCAAVEDECRPTATSSSSSNGSNNMNSCEAEPAGFAEAMGGAARMVQGLIDVGHGHYAKAKKNLSTGRDAFSRHSGALLLWGLDHIERDATEGLSRAARGAAALQQAEEALKAGKPKTCLRAADQVLKESPESVRAITLRSEALLRSDRPKEALAYTEAVLGQLHKELDKRLYTNLLCVQA